MMTKYSSLTPEEQQREKLKDSLISDGFTNENEINEMIDMIINPIPDISDLIKKENRLYFSKNGGVTKDRSQSIHHKS
jgi:hypothetical protein